MTGQATPTSQGPSGGLPPMPDTIVVAPEKKSIDWKRLIFLFLGLGLFALFFAMPAFDPAVDPRNESFPLTREAQLALGLFLLASTWWIFEVAPIGVTAIMIGLMQVLFYIREPEKALGDFLSPPVWFIFGSLVLGMAFTKSGLTKRMAYKMLNLVGERTSMIMLGCFVIIALMTHLMAHTAVAAAIFPLLMAINALYTDKEGPTKFGKALFIGMAYVAGAGSICTYLGAARAVSAVGFFKEITGNDISFFELSQFMMPVGWIMVFLLWGFFMLVFKPEKPRIENLRERVAALAKEQGAMTIKEWLVLITTVVVVGLFMAKSLIPADAAAQSGFLGFIKGMDRPGIILIATMIFFLTGVLDVNDLEAIPWNIVLLFGGAMSIGYCLWQTGAANWIAVHWLNMFTQAPPLLFVLSIAFLVLMMTNFIMNVAAIAICLPVALVVGKYLGVEAYVILFACLVTAGMPFNLLIGAAPNAIAYESKQFTTGEFFTWGWVANVILMVVLTLAILVIWPMMGLSLFTAPAAG
ncbi:sodium/sulphate symporter [Desulfarculus baarsii DSM 2075]|uniref:Sodium/sulphate symporter n=2 Tax=Desulfarculus baarsii TaxID=453230 RepID=E1QLI0_DESB2|nr:sodium/sulphate symporter [Desulfarculus baarsii DSM 2075]